MVSRPWIASVAGLAGLVGLGLCVACSDRAPRTKETASDLPVTPPGHAPLSSPPHDAARAASPYIDIARATNRFALSLWSRAPAGNAAMSPASIATALAIVWGGAKGDTATQLQKALQLEGAPDVLLSRWGALYKSLQDEARRPTLALANRLYGDRSFPFDTTYFTIVRHAFDVWIEPVDFATDPDGTRKRINTWVAESTVQRITELMPHGSVDPDTRMVLVNAIYFRGDWVHPFDAAATEPRDFFAGATKRQVPTMHQTRPFMFVHDAGVAMVELPYEGNSVSMYVLVPDARDGLAALEEKLLSLLPSLQSKLAKRTVHVALPRFKIDPPSSIDLTTHLKALGVIDAFDRTKADLSNIAKPKTPTDRLSISAVFHKALVEVDEKGTEAAAATAVTMPRAGSLATPVELRADHPFLFVIADRPSGIILFIGRVADPSRP